MSIYFRILFELEHSGVFYCSLCSAPLYLLSNYCECDNQWSNLQLDETRHIRTFYNIWFLNSLPFFLLSPFSPVQNMGLYVFFFPVVLKGSHLPWVLVPSYCPMIAVCSLSSPCTQLTSPWHLLTFFKKEKKKSSHAKYIRNRTFPESSKRKMQKGFHFLLPTHWQFAPDFCPPGDHEVPSGIALAPSLCPTESTPGFYYAPSCAVLANTPNTY